MLILIEFVAAVFVGVDESGNHDMIHRVDGFFSRGGSDAFLGIVKMQVNAIMEQDPGWDWTRILLKENSAVAEELLDSLNATAEGTEVSVVIPKPAGFEDAVKSIFNKYSK